MALSPLPALVVEMDPFFAILVREALDASGIACRVAYSARAAAQLARTEAFQLVFLSVRLPDDSGLNQLAGIRQQQGAGLPILVVGTDDTPEFRREALAAGANEYLLKPVSLAELRRAVLTWTVEAGISEHPV